jgi:hypothetical protein
MARSRSYSDKLAAEICRRIAEGESLLAICRDAHMPSRTTVCKWLGTHEQFTHNYARARDLQADHYAEEALSVARDAIGGDAELSQSSRLLVDTLKWTCARMAPRRWGDSSAVTLQNPDGSALGFAGLVRAARSGPVRDDLSPHDEP